MRHLLRVRLVKRFAKFAAVNFRVLPDLGLHFLWIVVPPLEMPGAKFSLGILLIAGALLGLAHLDVVATYAGINFGTGLMADTTFCCGFLKTFDLLDSFVKTDRFLWAIASGRLL